MTLQNRVDPFGRLVADPGRGLLTGNRGCLHDDGQVILRSWRSRAWISCLLVFKDWHRAPMPPRRWTALFFLDEATALAAGHRPCGTCRRDRLKAWRAALGPDATQRLGDLDRRLHAERRSGERRWLPAAAVPDGAMIEHEGRAWLVRAGAMQPWSFAGYGPAQILPRLAVTVLTPPLMLQTLQGGYAPLLHPSSAPS
ncbi:hypothetical protein [Zavarzinia sp. CC-PAN008]|uniref:hypothetical protein n=1 Tax=Zavarzinia sp. CC-PAN008 TaxID=3243332 RepID=UPI003F745470